MNNKFTPSKVDGVKLGSKDITVRTKGSLNSFPEEIGDTFSKQVSFYTNCIRGNQ